MDDLWFGVRCIFRHAELAYEERITIWQAANFAEAVASAEAEAAIYASDLGDCDFTGLTQAFHMFEAPGNGAEVFSLMRESDLDPVSYLHTFFTTGRELQRRASS